MLILAQLKMVPLLHFEVTEGKGHWLGSSELHFRWKLDFCPSAVISIWRRGTIFRGTKTQLSTKRKFCRTWLMFSLCRVGGTIFRGTKIRHLEKYAPKIVHKIPIKGFFFFFFKSFNIAWKWASIIFRRNFQIASLKQMH